MLGHDIEFNQVVIIFIRTTFHVNLSLNSVIKKFKSYTDLLETIRFDIVTTPIYVNRV